MDIPDSSFWGAVGAVGTIVAWLIRVEARFHNSVTRKEHKEGMREATTQLEHQLEDARREHKEVMKERTTELQEQLTEIKHLIERYNEQGQLHRSLVGDSLAQIRIQIAVIRDRIRDAPSDDQTGTFRRG